VLSIYASRPHAFSEDQCRLMEMIAPHVATAVSRSRRQEQDAPAPGAEKRAHGGPLRLVATSR
jgi:GAF domain-containing protein